PGPVGEVGQKPQAAAQKRHQHQHRQDAEDDPLERRRHPRQPLLHGGQALARRVARPLVLFRLLHPFRRLLTTLVPLSPLSLLLLVFVLLPPVLLLLALVAAILVGLLLSLPLLLSVLAGPLAVPVLPARLAVLVAPALLLPFGPGLPGSALALAGRVVFYRVL